MMINSLKKCVFNSSGTLFSVSACRYASRKQPTFVETDSREQDPMPAFLRTAIQKKMTEPFSEVKEDTFFNAVVKSFEPSRDGPPKRLSWNKDTISWNNIVRVIKRKRRDYEIFQQRYLQQRHEQLGNEIAAAHFIVFRGGAVNFHGSENWVKLNKGDDVEAYDKNLPKKFVPSLYLKGIDASGVVLYYEGLENIHKLANLKWLSFKGNKLFNDWCLDKISAEFYHSLEYLDISDCSVSYRGISSLCKMQNLSTLVVDNISNSLEFQLSCVMLQDVLPNLRIEGVSYLDANETSTENSDSSKISENYKKSEEKSMTSVSQ